MKNSKYKNLKFVINNDTLRKIHTYSRLVCEEAGTSRECYGFLLSSRDINDGIIYDAILACEQSTNSSRGVVDKRGIKETKKEYNAKGYKAIGCWQSHGHGEVFHSPADNTNLENLTYEAGGNCIIGKQRHERIMIDADKITLYQQEGDDVVFDFKNGYSFSGKIIKQRGIYSTAKLIFKAKGMEVLLENRATKLKLTTESELSIKTIKKEQEELRGIVYSLVVNTKGDNYVEASVVEWNLDSTINRIVRVKDLKIKTERISDLEFSENELREEVKRKVKAEPLFGMFGRLF